MKSIAGLPFWSAPTDADATWSPPNSGGNLVGSSVWPSLTWVCAERHEVDPADLADQLLERSGSVTPGSVTMIRSEPAASTVAPTTPVEAMRASMMEMVVARSAGPATHRRPGAPRIRVGVHPGYRRSARPPVGVGRIGPGDPPLTASAPTVATSRAAAQQPEQSIGGSPTVAIRPGRPGPAGVRRPGWPVPAAVTRSGMRAGDAARDRRSSSCLRFIVGERAAEPARAPGGGGTSRSRAANRGVARWRRAGGPPRSAGRRRSARPGSDGQDPRAARLAR